MKDDCFVMAREKANVCGWVGVWVGVGEGVEGLEIHMYKLIGSVGYWLAIER